MSEERTALIEALEAALAALRQDTESWPEAKAEDYSDWEYEELRLRLREAEAQVEALKRVLWEIGLEVSDVRSAHDAAALRDVISAWKAGQWTRNGF